MPLYADYRGLYDRFRDTQHGNRYLFRDSARACLVAGAVLPDYRLVITKGGYMGIFILLLASIGFLIGGFSGAAVGAILAIVIGYMAS